MTRVALYSHDSQGLGHVRRNLAIAAALHAADPRTRVLVVSGADEAAALPRPAGCDVLGLPGLVKDRQGRYASRHLDVPIADLVALRGSVLAAALCSFAPDVMIVDRHVRGFGGELERGLDSLPASTRVVLGLRDVLDDPAEASREWSAHGGTAALERWYSEIWVYGDPRVFDCVGALGLPAHWRSRVRFTGYLAGPPAPPAADAGRLGALCLVGGGSDGSPLATAFARADWGSGRALLVLGPQMSPGDRRAVRRAAGDRPDLEVADFVADLRPRLATAACAVTMGGYNSVCELLAQGVRTLVVPRVSPRREQAVRADRLAALGLVDVLHPHELAPSMLTRWLRGEVGGDVRPHHEVDLSGLRAVPRLLRDLSATPTAEVADVAV